MGLRASYLKMAAYSATHSGAAADEDLYITPPANEIWEIIALQALRNEAGDLTLFLDNTTDASGVTVQLCPTETMLISEILSYPGGPTGEANEVSGTTLYLDNTHSLVVRAESLADTKIVYCNVYYRKHNNQ